MLGNIHKVVFVRVERIRVSEAGLKWLNGSIGPRVRKSFEDNLGWGVA